MIKFLMVVIALLFEMAGAGVKADSWFEENNIPIEKAKEYNEIQFQQYQCTSMAAQYYEYDRKYSSMTQEIVQAKKKAIEQVISVCELGCQNNSADDCAALARIYRITPSNDSERTMRTFLKACDLGDAGSCTDIGVIFYMEHAYFRALRYHKKACQAGSMAGCANLGDAYRRGLGVRQDDKKALEYLGKACDSGIQMACRNYAKIKRRQ
jgi:TPR repeat protein